MGYTLRSGGDEIWISRVPVIQEVIAEKWKKWLDEIVFSLLLRRFLFVAQSVEQLTLNQRVVGSSPSQSTNFLTTCKYRFLWNRRILVWYTFGTKGYPDS